MTHAIRPATQEVEIGRIVVQVKPRQKVRETLSQPISRHGSIPLSS
jgi:hypothetical protein